jgi:hypothetical protein
MAFYRLQYIELILNFARLKNICKILTTYQGFCNLFFTAQNSAMPAVPENQIEKPSATHSSHPAQPTCSSYPTLTTSPGSNYHLP